MHYISNISLFCDIVVAKFHALVVTTRRVLNCICCFVLYCDMAGEFAFAFYSKKFQLQLKEDHVR